MVSCCNVHWNSMVKKKTTFVISAFVTVICLMTTLLKYYPGQTGVKHLQKKHNAKKETSVATQNIPWRFTAEQDGFVLPLYDTQNEKKNKFIMYDPLNIPITRQILQFQIAVIFADMLERTLLVPPIITLSQYNETLHIPMSAAIDFKLLSKAVQIKELLPHKTDWFREKTVYEVCHDPRLGYWLDYIPSTENIQAWKLLKQQQFVPLKLRFLNNVDTPYGCAGTEQYFGRWGPPLKVKPLYRGILTELWERNEDIIAFKQSTFDTSYTRFFNKNRVKKAQKIILFFFHFSEEITEHSKRVATSLGPGYIAISATAFTSSTSFDQEKYIIEQIMQIETTSKNIFVMIGSNTSRKIFQPIINLGYNVTFNDVIDGWWNTNSVPPAEEILPPYLKNYFTSLLLCIYADHFIHLKATSDLHFIKHLRIQDKHMSDGLVWNDINLKWIKHTVINKADDKKILKKNFQNKPKSDVAFTATQLKNKTTFIPSLFHLVMNNFTSQKFSIKEARRKTLSKKHALSINRETILACTFCSYIKALTGDDACLHSMKGVC